MKLGALFKITARCRLKAVSLAVTGLPDANFRFFVMVNVQVRPSGLMSHRSASPGKKWFEELEKQIRESGPAITLDLEEVTLVDVEIVRFLGTCEARGATLLNCSPLLALHTRLDRQRARLKE
jgi:hypothetical protein